MGPVRRHPLRGPLLRRDPGRSAQLSGTAVLEAGPGSDGSAARITADGEANVSIPFVAKKVESLVVENLQELMESEREFTLQWIAEHP